ncbi:MAG: P1 family peptidase [Pelolinea sp.]|nr:P1 family peptidase [Pelolinea sp.]
MKKEISITDIDGIQIGQVSDTAALTGCTVILCKDGAVGGVDQRGGAPGTRETDLLHPMHLVEKVQAILLAGGSAFGLDAASGVMRYLEEQKCGVETGYARVPIVPSAILYDLGMGSSTIRPNAEMGYQACCNASRTAPQNGNFGAGTGASVGKFLGMGQAMKSGIGSAAMEISSGIVVGAIIAVNAFGDVYDPASNTILAGTRSLKKGPIKIGEAGYFADTQESMRSMVGKTVLSIAAKQNTVIGAVITNADLNKEETNKIAQMGQDGLARVIRPAHTMLDGDTLFALATGRKKCDVNTVGAFAAEMVAQAILNAVKSADPAGNLPSYLSIHS